METSITNDDFDRILMEIIDSTPASHLLTLPGVYELLSEHFNNDVLCAYEMESYLDE